MRLGCLPYLNVKPLVYPFEHGELPEGWELVYEPPSVLAQMLGHGEIAAAPVSSFACLANPELWAVPGICIASRGPVKSVLMLSKVPVNKVRSVALDTSSLSGAAMLKIVLAELYNIVPEYIPSPPEPEWMLAYADAALLIGNAAMLAPKDGLYVLDLGEAWTELVRLPAVFAVWAGRREALTPEMTGMLQHAKEEGIRRIHEIAHGESARLGLAYDECYDYLANVMCYDLGWQEIQSMEAFARKCHEHGLTPMECSIKVAE